MWAIAPRTEGNLFDKVVGWKGALILEDPDARRTSQAVFSKDADRTIMFANPNASAFSIEAVPEADADLVLPEFGFLERFSINLHVILQLQRSLRTLLV